MQIVGWDQESEKLVDVVAQILKSWTWLSLRLEYIPDGEKLRPWISDFWLLCYFLQLSQ